MKRTIRSFLTLLTVTVCVPGAMTPAQAEISNDPTAFAGGLLGLSSVDNGIGTGIGFGVQGAYFLSNLWAVGPWIRVGNHDGGWSSSVYAAQAIYQLDWLYQGLHAGPILGIGRTTFSGITRGLPTVAEDTSPAFGGKAGVDFNVSKRYPISVGADVSLVFYEAGETLLTSLNPLVSVKYWF